MKRVAIITLLTLTSYVGNAQFGGILKKVKEKASSKTEEKVEDKVSSVIDNSIDKIFGIPKNKKNSSTELKDDALQSRQQDPTKKGIKSYSKFDFVPGERIVYAEDFSKDAIGEMPLNWFTQGKGELMRLEGHEGNWLRGFKSSQLSSISNVELGENYTVEFDLIYYFQPVEPVYVMPDIRIRLLNNYKKSISGNPRNGENSFTINIHPKEEKSIAWIDTYLDAPVFKSDDLEIPFFSTKYNVIQHYSIQVQKNRIRVWIDENKIFDIPQIIDNSRKFARIAFELGGTSYSENEVGFFLSNIRFANGVPDTRHKLIDEGKFSTTGILFALNSAEIQPSSYGVLKEISNVLKENPNVKIKIIGHTSSDGNKESNLQLSIKRSEAIKHVLEKEFSIEISRMSTEGKGDSQPVAPNSSLEGRIQNRRVEFIKL